MEEKVLIEGQKVKYNIFAIIMYVIGIVISVVILLYDIGLDDWYYWLCWACFALPFFLTGFIVSCWLSKIEITVTDKRVCGRATFGKRVDLPIDSISAVGTSALLGIDVGTSSGRIHFKLIKNRDQVHKILSDLLIKRQEKIYNETISKTNVADELKKFKELLDAGIISQEEFDAKKKQLLGL